MERKTDSLIFGVRHFLVEFVTDRVIASLWVPTTLASTDDVWDEAARFSRLHQAAVAVHICGDREGWVAANIN